MSGRSWLAKFNLVSRVRNVFKAYRNQSSEFRRSVHFIIILMIAASPGLVFGNAYYNLLMFWRGDAFAWSGRGINNKWSTKENWTARKVPGPGDIAVFDGACLNTAGAFCNPEIDLDPNCLGINVKSSYPSVGSFIVSPTGNIPITMGTFGINLSSGKMDLSNATTGTINGPISIGAGGSSGLFLSALNGGTYSSAVTITSGTMITTGSNVFGQNLASVGSASLFSAGTSSVVVGGTLSVSAGTYLSTSGLNNFANITQSGGVITAGNAVGCYLKVTNGTFSGGTFNSCLTGGSFTSQFNVNGATINLFGNNNLFELEMFSSTSVVNAGTSVVTCGTLFMTNGSYNSSSGSNSFNYIDQRGGLVTAGNAAGCGLTVSPVAGVTTGGTLSGGTFSSCIAGGTFGGNIYVNSGADLLLSGNNLFQNNLSIVGNSGSVISAGSSVVTTNGTFSIANGTYSNTSGTSIFGQGVIQTGGQLIGGSLAGSQLTVGTLTTTLGTSYLGGGTLYTSVTASSFGSNIVVSGGNLVTYGTNKFVGNVTIGANSASAVLASTSAFVTQGSMIITGGSYFATSGTTYLGSLLMQNPNVTTRFNAQSGPVTIDGNFNFNSTAYGGGGVTDPIFNPGSGPLRISGNLVVNGTSASTTLDCSSLGSTCFSLSSGTTELYGDLTLGHGMQYFNHNNGLFVFAGANQLISQYPTVSTTVGTFNHVDFKYKNVITGAPTTGTKSFSGSYANLVVGGTLSFSADVSCTTGSCLVNSGTISTVGGYTTPLLINNNGVQGTGSIRISGGTNTILAPVTASQLPSGGFIIDKYNSTNTVTLSPATGVSFDYSTAGTFSVVSGSFLVGINTNTNSLLVKGLNIESGGSLVCNGGKYTASGLTTVYGGIYCTGVGGFYPYNWTGLGGDGLWSNGANWQNGTASPSATDAAIFGVYNCGANCNATVNVGTSVGSVMLLGGYSGTITQSNPLTIAARGGLGAYTGTFLSSANLTDGGFFNVGTGSFGGGATYVTVGSGASINGGIVSMTSGSFYSPGGFNISSGSFTTTTGNLTVGSYSQSGGYVSLSGGTFAGSSLATISGGTMSLGSGPMSVAGYTQSGGIVTGTATFISSGAFSISAGSFGDWTSLVSVTSYTQSGGMVRLNSPVSSGSFRDSGSFLQSAGTFYSGAGNHYVSGTSYRITGGSYFPTTATFTIDSSGGANVTLMPSSGSYSSVNLTTSGGSSVDLRSTWNIYGLLVFGDNNSNAVIGSTSGNDQNINAFGDINLNGFGYYENNGAGNAVFVIAQPPAGTSKILRGTNTKTGYISRLSIISTGTLVVMGTIAVDIALSANTGVPDFTTNQSTVYISPISGSVPTVMSPIVGYPFYNLVFSGGKSILMSTTDAYVTNMLKFENTAVNTGINGIGRNIFVTGGSIVLAGSGYGQYSSAKIHVGTNAIVSIYGNGSTVPLPNITFDQGSTTTITGNLNVSGDYIAAVTGTAAVINASAANLTFGNSNNTTNGYIVPDSSIYGAVTFANYQTLTIGTTGAGTFSIGGNLVLGGASTSCVLNKNGGGTLNPMANITYTGSGCSGNIPMLISGTSNTVMSRSSSSMQITTGGITINKPASNYTVSYSSTDATYGPFVVNTGSFIVNSGAFNVTSCTGTAAGFIKIFGTFSINFNVLSSGSTSCAPVIVP